MKSPEGWPIAARMIGILSHERKSAEAQGGGKEEKDFLIQGSGPHRSWGRKRLMLESRSDRAIRDGGRGGSAAEMANQSGDGWVRMGRGGSQRIVGFHALDHAVNGTRTSETNVGRRRAAERISFTA